MQMAVQETPADFYPDGEIPPPEDRILTDEARSMFGLLYTTLQGWWNTGKIQRFHVGWRLVLSRRQVERMVAYSRTVRPIPPRQSKQGEPDRQDGSSQQ